MKTVRKSCTNLDGLMPYDPKYLAASAYLSANENPNDMPEEIRREVDKKIRSLTFNRYPDPLANELRDLIAEGNGLERENILVGNGGDELLFNLALAWGGPGRVFLDLPPTFSVYENNARLTGTATEVIPRRADYSIDEEAVLKRLSMNDIDCIIIASPNNPTGQLADDSFLVKVLEASDALVVIDEAYFEFSRRTMRPYLEQHKNLVILRTFSKAFSLAGVRMGYVLAHPEVITELIKVRQPYSVDSVSQEIAKVVYQNRAQFEERIRELIEQREWLIKELRKTPEVNVYPSDSNYILFKIEDAQPIWEALYNEGILIRDLSNVRYLEDCLRVTIGTEEENRLFLSTLKQCLEQRRKSVSRGQAPGVQK